MKWETWEVLGIIRMRNDSALTRGGFPGSRGSGGVGGQVGHFEDEADVLGVSAAGGGREVSRLGPTFCCLGGSWARGGFGGSAVGNGACCVLSFFRRV